MTPWRELLGLPTSVNDIHSALNATSVRRVLRPRDADGVAAIVRRGEPLSVSGGRHSMGGQPFLSDGLLLDTRRINTLTALDVERGIATIGAGVVWPDFLRQLRAKQPGSDFYWTYRQKQTGADRLTLGGSIASNIHGRGLTMRPIVDDTEAMEVVTPSGHIARVTRGHELWPFVIGGYGLFGVVTGVELRLTRRQKLRRQVVIREIEGVAEAFEERIAQGYRFGDFQFAIDDRSSDFLRRGVFACYEPVADDTPIRADQKEVPRRAWHYLVYLAHANKSEAFRLYEQFYKSTDGQIYWSDTHQMTPYLDHYHQKLDRKTDARCSGSEMITELYVPRAALETFLDHCRVELAATKASVIYGTIRLVEPDMETVLPWAAQNWACIIFNLHVDHDAQGIETAMSRFRTLIDIAQSLGGSFYLTYHRWATREQVERSYPRMAEFLRAKLDHDPGEVLRSDWYLHMKSLFGSPTADNAD